jgi:hypothetical protein
MSLPEEPLPFAQWKANLQKMQEGRIEDRYWYYAEYGRYCDRINTKETNNEDDT